MKRLWTATKKSLKIRATPIAIWENMKKQLNIAKKGLEISTAIGDQSGIARENRNLGTTYFRLGEYKKAISYFEES